MIGTILNVGAILAGGGIGIFARKQFSPKTETRIKLFLGVMTIYVGFRTFWSSINGTFTHVLKEIAIVLVSIVAGNLIGRTLRLQRAVNRLGEIAKGSFRERGAGRPKGFAEGFVTCTILFCVGPMAILGALEDGLSGRIQTLAIKSLMDGLATIAFVKSFGIGPIFAAIPVLAYQGSITLGARLIEPVLSNHLLLDSLNATGGLLILCISLVILDIQKVPLADYLPSLVVAPVLTWLLS